MGMKRPSPLWEKYGLSFIHAFAPLIPLRYIQSPHLEVHLRSYAVQQVYLDAKWAKNMLFIIDRASGNNMTSCVNRFIAGNF